MSFWKKRNFFYKTLSIKEYLGLGIIGVLLSYLYFRKIFSVFIFAVTFVGGIYILQLREYKKKESGQLQEFKMLLQGIINGMYAGYSMENAFLSAERELAYTYGKNSYLNQYLLGIKKKIHLNIPMEQCFIKFAEEVSLEEIRNFSEIFYFTRKSGGNLIHNMEIILKNIQDKWEIQQEIDTILAEKRLELSVMIGMPTFFLGYLNLTNPQYLDIFYTTLGGKIGMIICLCLQGLGLFIGGRIIDIKV